MSSEIEPLLQIDEVLRIRNGGRTHLYLEIAEGTFPAPIKLGRASRWIPEEVRAAIEKRRQERDELIQRKTIERKSKLGGENAE